MELINRIRKSRKGFTLVEIIVVLVILAILAAFTIPSMIGFVEDAKSKAAIAQQRQIYVSAQATATEYFGKGTESKLGMSVDATSGKIVLSEAKNLGSAAAAALTGTGLTTESPALTMLDRLSTDLKPGAGAKDDETVNWTVTVDPKGRVTEVTFIKDGKTYDPLVIDVVNP